MARPIRAHTLCRVTKRTHRPRQVAGALSAVAALVLLSGCNTSVTGQPRFVNQGEAAPSSHPRTPSVSPNVSTTTRTELVSIPYPTESVDDATMEDGRRRVLTPGVNGTRELTYRITLSAGRETAKQLVSLVVLKRPVSMVIAIGTRVAQSEKGCNANYSGCVPIASDVDCVGGGNGPVYVKGPDKVLGIDIYHLDLDGNGIGCDGPEDIP